MCLHHIVEQADCEFEPVPTVVACAATGDEAGEEFANRLEWRGLPTGVLMPHGAVKLLRRALSIQARPVYSTEEDYEDERMRVFDIRNSMICEAQRIINAVGALPMLPA